MTQKVDVAALAKLARLDVSDDELARLEKELPAILDFVEQIQTVSADVPRSDPEHRNVMRDDGNPHESGLFTDDLLQAAPATKGSHVVVKQVLSKKQ
ncbi:MAG TPA: Asp-tRNA(Asn)/Glu-tRNA(Gln) amidotransferase subunit GatC [Candidatus Paceibacterota bacterium]|nr:Asp-tRNA(Asn)/Glu-tRNA(Gln) amidotransferase subunit GatC [Candidatus Paceibacterota bacterium]